MSHHDDDQYDKEAEDESMASSASTIRRASTSPVNFVQRIEKDNASRTRRIVLPSPDFQRGAMVVGLVWVFCVVGLWWSVVVLVYWVYDFFFLAVGLLVVVVCSAAVVEWGCWGFLFCFDFLLWVLWLICG